MTTLQRIIKYGAIAFGTYLTVVIISVAVAIISGIFASSKIIDLYDKKSNNLEDRLDKHQGSYDSYYDISNSL